MGMTTSEHEKRPLKEQYEDVLSRLKDNGVLTRQDAIECEIERMASQLTEYLDSYREWIRAEGIHRVLNKSSLSTAALDSAFRQAVERADAAKKNWQALDKQYKNEVAYLKDLLGMRDA